MKKKCLQFLKKIFTYSIPILNVKISGKALGFAVFFALLTQMVSAQTTITWTGLVSSDATQSVNWNPQLAPWANTLVIDSAKKYVNKPILNVDITRSVLGITHRELSKLTVNVPEGVIFTCSSVNYYPSGNLYKTGKGTYKPANNRSIYIEGKNSPDTIFISEGTIEENGGLLMGNADNGINGGKIYISGTGKFAHNQISYFPGRWSKDSTLSVIQITDNGTFTSVRDYRVDAAKLIARRQIRSTPDRDIVSSFDPLTNITTIYSRPKMAFLAEPPAVQKIKIGEKGAILNLAKNDGLASKDSLTWKYATVSGGPYTAFSPLQNRDTLTPIFAQSGTYFVVCEGMVGNTPEYTNEVVFVVSSDKVVISPDALQRLKIGQTPYTLSVTETGTVTSREWFYTYTSGRDYKSFDPKQTGTELSPVFDSATTYYITCKSVIGGITETAKEVDILYTKRSVVSDVTWIGKYSTDAADMRNFSPFSYMNGNNVLFDTTKYTANEPIYSLAGNDTVSILNITKNASFTLNKPQNDTLTTKGDNYLGGTLFIKSGIFRSTGFVRMTSKFGRLDISGGTYFQPKNDFLIGNGVTATEGGYVNIHGTGKMIVPNISRFNATDSLQSVIKIWDEGKLEIHNSTLNYDQSVLGLRIAKRQIRTEKDWELVVNTAYLATDTIYTISAFDPTAISITPVAEQILKVNEPASVLSASNTMIYDSLIWKYSTSFDGELTAFEPAIHDTFATPSFSNPGNYYVICVGMNDTLTKKSNKVKIVVPDVSISPIAKQVMQDGGSGIKYTVTETPTPTNRLWKTSTTKGGPYSVTSATQITTASYTAQFATTGTYYVICESTYGSKAINSNEVEVEVVDVEISPATNQTIKTNEDGNKITVTETGTSSGREWKYSTTKGSGYASFSPAEKAVDYTPKFATAGTYYVICASVFSGVTIESNEVRITVTPGTGIYNSIADGFVVYPNPSTGSFIIDNELATSYRVEIYNTQGKLVLSREYNNVSQPQEINLDSKGIYIINLITQNQVKTSKLIVE